MKIGFPVQGGSTTRAAILMMPALIALPAMANQITVNLNTASSFGLLGGTISNTGTSQVAGNVGATTTITGFGAGTGTATGTIYPFPSNATVAQAYTDFESAWTSAMSLTSTQSIGSSLPTSFTFMGNNVYSFTTPTITTTTGTSLTFNAQNNPNEVFVIQIQGALNVIGALNFTLENGAQADNIFWIVGSAATISVGSSGPITFDGNILAGGAGGTFTMSAASGGSGVLAGTINGCVFTNAANTLAGETDINGCSATTAAGTGTPEPGSSSLLVLGCLIGGFGLRRLRRSKALAGRLPARFLHPKSVKEPT